jgi:hypothetical protein
MDSNSQRPLAPGGQQEAGLPIFKASQSYGMPQEHYRDSAPYGHTQKRVACKQCRQAKVQHPRTQYLLGPLDSRHIQSISNKRHS